MESYDPYKEKPYLFTSDVVKNTTAAGLRQSLLSQSRAATDIWNNREALKRELAAVKTRLATCEKVILDSVLSKTPPTA
jgi:hypothetical protein